MPKKYMIVLRKNGEEKYSSCIYNGLEFVNIYYVNNFNVTALYLPFTLEFFYIHINNKRVALRTLPYN